MGWWLIEHEGERLRSFLSSQAGRPARRRSLYPANVDDSLAA